MALLQQLDYWHWLILSVLLVILEIFSPGVFLIWMGLAAGLVGLLLLAFPELGWHYQLLGFAPVQRRQHPRRPQLSAAPSDPD